MTREHRHEIEIDASSDDVWRAVTDGEELTRWYADQASVTPGEGGSVTVGWETDDGTAAEGTARIDVWQPGQRLRLVEEQSEGFPPAEQPTVQEWTIESAGGKTVLRLVHSGFPETDDWDGIYDSTDYGWDAFLVSLRHYLERHPGQPRRAVVATQAAAAGPAAAWNAVAAAMDLGGGRMAATLSTGERLSGAVLLQRAGKVLLTSVDQLDDGLLFVTLDMGAVWASLAAYGPARARLGDGGGGDGGDGLGERWRAWMLATTK